MVAEDTYKIHLYIFGMKLWLEYRETLIFPDQTLIKCMIVLFWELFSWK